MLFIYYRVFCSIFILPGVRSALKDTHQGVQEPNRDNHNFPKYYASVTGLHC